MAEFSPANPVEEEEQTEEDDQEEPVTDQVVPSIDLPGQAPMSPVRYNHHRHQVVPNPVPRQAPIIRPMIYNQQQYQAFPINAVTGQAPLVRPMMNCQQQDQAFPNAVTGQAPMIRPTTNNQNQNQDQEQVVPNVVPGQTPMIRPMAMQPAPMMLRPNYTYNPRPVFVAAQNFFNPNYHLNPTPFTHIQYPYMRTEDNHQKLIMPQFTSDQMFTTMSPSGEIKSHVVVQDHWNPQLHYVMSLDDALVLGPSTQQFQAQMQQPN